MSMTEKLAYIKKLRHLTTEEIAQQSGVPLGTLNKIFSGQTKNPAVGPVDKITQVLRIPIHYLLDDELPIEYHVSTSTDDGILLALLRGNSISHEIPGSGASQQAGGGYHDRTSQYAAWPVGRKSAGQADLLLCNRSSRGLQPIG